MKALYKFIFLSAALMVGFSSCSKDELPPTGGRDNAEKLVAGTYVGEWTRNLEKTDQVDKASGTITFSVDEENYGNNIYIITVSSSGLDLGLNSNRSVCNISLMSSGVFSYWNNSTGNPFGKLFYGKVDADGVVTMQYETIITDPVARKDKVYIYSFRGTKQD